MAIPTSDPTWATDTNYSAGSDPWSGQPNKSAPSGGKRGSGFVPDADDAAEEDNYIVGAHGDWIKFTNNNVIGDGFVFKEEWLKATIDTDIWTSANTGVGVAPAVLSDNANGGYGAIKVALTSSSAGTSTISALATPVGTADFSFSCRVRIPALPSVSSFNVGLWSATAAKKTYFQCSNGGGGWIIVENSGGGSAGAGVAATVYQHLRMVRASGVLYAYVDGVLGYTNANTVDLSDAFVTISLPGTHAGACDVRVDMTNLWIDR